jgi:hypothetical protein
MDAKLFEVLGKFAGLAGISLGIVLVIFRAVLKNIPAVSKTASYNLLRQLLYLTFIVAIVGIAAWFFASRVNHRITGHVLQKDSREPLAEADIVLSGRTETAKSDDHGNFYITLVDEPLPATPVPLYVSKHGYKVYEVGVVMGQNIEAELSPTPVLTASFSELPVPSDKLPVANPPDQHPSTTPTQHEVKPPTDSQKILFTTERYQTDQVASGVCKDFGAWATLCSPDRPKGWTIADQKFELTGDRAGCAYAQCEPLGTPTETKACYQFRTQGHDEECGHSGNTGIHYSQGALTVTWKHQ